MRDKTARRVAIHDHSIHDVEKVLIENLELRDKVLDLAARMLPLLKDSAEVGDVHKMLEKMSPVAVMVLYDRMLSTTSDKVAADCAKTISFMGGYKPVEKSVNINGNVDKMSEQQVDSFIANMFKHMTEEDKSKIINLVKAPDGTFLPAEENQGITVDNLEIIEV